MKKLDPQRVYRIMMIAMIGCVIVYCISNALFIINYPEDIVFTISDFLPPAVCLLGVLVLHFTKERTLIRALLVGSMVLCFVSLFAAYMMLVEYADIVEYSLVNFVNGVIQFLIGVLLLVNILMFAKKHSASTVLIFVSMLGMIFVNVVDIITPIRYGMDLDFIIGNILGIVPAMVLLVLLMLITVDDTIRSETMLFSIESAFHDIRGSKVPIGVEILRSDLRDIDAAQEKGAWENVHEFGLKSAAPNDYKIVFERKDGRTLTAFSPSEDTAAFDSHRFFLRGILPDNGDVETCDTVRFYGEDGFFRQFIVVETFETGEDKYSYIKKKGAEEKEK